MTATHRNSAAANDPAFISHAMGRCGGRLPIAAGVAGGAVGMPSGLSQRPFRPRVDLIVPVGTPRARQSRRLAR